MAKILIYLENTEAGKEYDIWDRCSNGVYYKNHILQYSCLNNINYANKLWFQSLISCISTPENIIYYYNKNMSPQLINEQYDIVICPQANLFCEYFISTIKKFTEFFADIKIPIYIIACGVQAKNAKEINELTSKIGEISKALIDTVYNTGGEFALRGYLTKEFFDKVSDNTAVVTGCPSIYQNGKKLQISNDKVSEKQFLPVFNGDIGAKCCLENDNSYFIDQETFFKYLYDKDYSLKSISKKEIYRLIRCFGYNYIELLFSNKIKLFVSMNQWYNFLKYNSVSFSFGSRIHGNIMPILAGVPALIYPKDERVREMADFYSIPIITDIKKKSAYEMYLNTDYTEFNRLYPKRFDDFEKFLIERGIVKKINQNNIFLFDKQYNYMNVNSDNLSDLLNKLHHKRYTLYSSALNLYRKFK